MDVKKQPGIAWLLLAFTLPTKRASQRVEVWRKLQRYGTVPLGNSGYLLPHAPVNEERFQWLATSVRKYGGDASIVHVQRIDNISTPQLIARFADACARDCQELTPLDGAGFPVCFLTSFVFRSTRGHALRETCVLHKFWHPVLRTLGSPQTGMHAFRYGCNRRWEFDQKLAGLQLWTRRNRKQRIFATAQTASPLRMTN